jgi:hypothetical protein
MTVNLYSRYPSGSTSPLNTTFVPGNYEYSYNTSQNIYSFRAWYFLKEHLINNGWHVKYSYGGATNYFGTGDYITWARWGEVGTTGPGNWFVLRSNSPISGSYREFLIRRQNTIGGSPSSLTGSGICQVWYSPSAGFSSGNSGNNVSNRPVATDEKQLLGDSHLSSFQTGIIAPWNAPSTSIGTNAYMWIGAGGNSWYMLCTSNSSPYDCYGVFAFEPLFNTNALDTDKTAIWISRFNTTQSSIRGSSSYTILGHTSSLWAPGLSDFRTMKAYGYTDDSNTNLISIGVAQTGYNMPIMLPIAISHQNVFKGYSKLFKWSPTNISNTDTIENNGYIKMDDIFIEWNGSTPVFT